MCIKYGLYLCVGESGLDGIQLQSRLKDESGDKPSGIPS